MKRTMVLLLLVSEEGEPKHIDTEGAEVDELSAIRPALAKCSALLEDDARRRKAGGR
jgi:hypothetical protein